MSVPTLSRSFARALVPVRHRPTGLPEAVVSATLSAERSALAGYQRVCGFAVDDAVPATYLHVLAFPLATAVLARRDFPFPLIGLVHVANSMTQHRRVRVGEHLRVRAHAENLREHRVGRQVDLVATAHAGTDLVWAGRSTYLHRERASRGDRPGRAPLPARAGAPARWRVPTDIGRRYAAVSGDHNPIHLHPLTARAFGFPRAIAHGMWLHAHALAGLEPRLPDAYRVDVEFKTPVLLPSTVAVSTQRADHGWRVTVTDAANVKPHLTLTTHPPD